MLLVRSLVPRHTWQLVQLKALATVIKQFFWLKTSSTFHKKLRLAPLLKMVLQHLRRLKA